VSCQTTSMTELNINEKASKQSNECSQISIDNSKPGQRLQSNEIKDEINSSSFIEDILNYWQNRKDLISTKIKEIENHLKAQISIYSKAIETSLNKEERNGLAVEFSNACNIFIDGKMTLINSTYSNNLMLNQTILQKLSDMESEFLTVLKVTYEKLVSQNPEYKVFKEEYKAESNDTDNIIDPNSDLLKTNGVAASLRSSVLTRKLKAVDFSAYSQKKKKYL